MTRKEIIEQILNQWDWDEEQQTYSSLTAFENQIELMNSFRKYYEHKGDLSDKQIACAISIVDQNEQFSRIWRNTRSLNN